VSWTDAELVQLTLDGDPEAFGKLVDRHRRTIFATMVQRGFQQAEADDMAQEVFIKAYRGLAGLQDRDHFARWLYGIAGHVAADAARSRKRRAEHIGLEDSEEIAAPRIEPDIFQAESADVIRAMGELPEDQRMVLTLRYLEGLSPKEIAERLGEPRGTVRSRLHHALSYLQHAFRNKAKV